jgi:hypothetical protein
MLAPPSKARLLKRQRDRAYRAREAAVGNRFRQRERAGLSVFQLEADYLELG